MSEVVISTKKIKAFMNRVTVDQLYDMTPQRFRADLEEKFPEISQKGVTIHAFAHHAMKKGFAFARQAFAEGDQETCSKALGIFAEWAEANGYPITVKNDRFFRRGAQMIVGTNPEEHTRLTKFALGRT